MTTASNRMSNTSAKLVKDKELSAEKGDTVLSKGAELLQMLQNFAQLANQEILICLKDKKTNQMCHFSTDARKFTINQVAKHSKTAHNLTEFQNVLKKLGPNRPSQDKEADNSSEMTMKSTNASSSGEKSQSVGVTLPFMPAECKRYDTADNHIFKQNSEQHKVDNYPIDNHLQGTGRPSHGLNSLSSLRGLDFAEELNDEAIHHTEDQLFKSPTMKKVTSVMDVCINHNGEEQDFVVDQLDYYQQYYEQKECKFVDHTNKLHEDKFCPIALRGNCRSKDFAQKHLFKSGFKSFSNAREDEEDEAQSFCSEDEVSCFTDEQDQESLQEADLMQEEADLTDPSNQLNGSSFGSNFNRYNDNFDTDEGPGSFNQLSSHLNTLNFVQENHQENHDMFLACCDWEAAIEEERHACKSMCSTPNHQTASYQEIKQCKRKTKLASKHLGFINESESSGSQRQDVSINSDQELWDSESIIKKVLGPNNTEKVVTRRHCKSKKHRGQNKKKVLMNTQSSRIDKRSDKSQQSAKSKLGSSLSSVVSITPINIPEMIDMLSDQNLNSNSSNRYNYNNCLSPLVNRM